MHMARFVWYRLCTVHMCSIDTSTEPTNSHPHLHANPTPTCTHLCLHPPPTQLHTPTLAPHLHSHPCTHLHLHIHSTPTDTPSHTYTCTPPPPTHLILQQQLQIPLCCLDGFLWQFRVHLGSEVHYLLRHLPRQTAHKVKGTTSSSLVFIAVTTVYSLYAWSLVVLI